MADAKECDRCFELFRPSEDRSQFADGVPLPKRNDSGAITWHAYDLCDICIESLATWREEPDEAD